MNKKFLIPIVICTIIVIAVISTCVGGGSKIKLQWNAVLPPEEINDSIELKVSDEELAARKATMAIKKKSGIKGALARYAAQVSSADKGAVINKFEG